MKDELTKYLSVATGISVEEISIDVPEREEFGDYSTNLALKSFTPEKDIKSPRDYAEALIEKINKDKELTKIIEKTEIAGPGFINFHLKKDVFIDTLLNSSSQYFIDRHSPKNTNKTVVIDYSSPNIAKPFGIGHLRSTIIGQAIYNIYKFLGYKVIGDNHIGDWGTQFGKLLYMIDRGNTSDFSIENLEKLYVEFHEIAGNPEKKEEMESSAREWFKKLEDGDPQAREIWQKCVSASMEEFNKVYKLLGVKIDHSYGESFYEEEMRDLTENEKVKANLTAMTGESKGWVIDLSDMNIKVPLMFLKSDGATTYATRDLATISFRMRKWNPSLMIYEVGQEQSLHFEQVFAAARKLGLVDDNVTFHHTKHGLYLAPDGKKFSTRKGKTIKLMEVLNEAIVRAKKLGSETEDLAIKVGIGAIKYFDLMHSVQSDVIFDWEKVMNMEGNSGPYLQYTYARIQSVLSKSTVKGSTSKVGDLNDEEMKLLRTFVHFPDVIIDSAIKYSPNILCNYLYEIAKKYNSFYNAHKIIGAENEDFRIKLSEKTAELLKTGLNLLGIYAPEKM